VNKPLFGHRFRVDLMGNAKFNDSVLTFDVNLVQRKITVEVFETEDCSVFPLVEALLKTKGASLTWEAMGSAMMAETVKTIFYHGIEIIDHQFKTDYNDHDMAMHVLTMSFTAWEVAE
jgi:hypothetical protein